MKMQDAVTARSGAPIDASYTEWVRAYDTLTARNRADILSDIPRMASQRTFGLLLPIGYAPENLLLETLNSLRAQLYPYWRVYLAGAPRRSGSITALIKADPRICIVDASRLIEPATAVATALRKSEDDYVAILAEGDQLPAHALYEIGLELARYPDAGLVYSDEDRIDFTGTRSRPRFKSGWDPDLLLGQDYLGGIAVYRRAAVEAAGGVRAGHGPAFGYDLALRATAQLDPELIRHVPAVLLHRPADAALGVRDRALGPMAHATRSAVRDFLGPRAKVFPSPLSLDCNRIEWPLPSPPSVTVIMPTRDHADVLMTAALGVLSRTDYPEFDLLIVDNDSRDDLTRLAFRSLTADPRVRVLRHHGPFNFAAINNAAVRDARGEVVVLLNNDVDIISADWLREMVSHAVRPDVGAVGAKLLYGDGRLQHGGIVLAPGPNAAHLHRLADRFDPGYGATLAAARSCAAVTGACLATRRSVYLEVGGLDEAGFPVAFNDIDLCLRLGEYGYRIVWTPFAELFHLESKSRGRADTEAKAAQERREIDLLDRLWRHAFDSDSYNNPNLGCAWEVPLHLRAPRRHRQWQSGAA